MKTMQTAVLCGLAALGALPRAGAAEDAKRPMAAGERPPTGEELRRHEFDAWFLDTARAVELNADVARLVWEKKPKAHALLELAHFVSRQDNALRRYLLRLAALQKKNGSLNPLDVELLSRMRLQARAKRELADQLDKACDDAGVAKREEGQSWRSVVGSAASAPKEGSLRYDVETGLWERFDAGTRAWKPHDPGAP